MPARSTRADAMILLLQVAVILALARAVRWIVVPLGQPAVVAEMVAGLLVGPSFLGWLMPRWADALFPSGSLEPLNALSQLGLVSAGEVEHIAAFPPGPLGEQAFQPLPDPGDLLGRGDRRDGKISLPIEEGAKLGGQL